MSLYLSKCLQTRKMDFLGQDSPLLSDTASRRENRYLCAFIGSASIHVEEGCHDCDSLV